jgi:hypothetical protein
MNTYKTNPLYFSYHATEGLTNVVELAQPTAVFIPGRQNRNAPVFQTARDKGAEVLPYLNIFERPISPSGLDLDFYGQAASVPLWIGPDGNPVLGWGGTHHLTDVRVGSPWIERVLDYIEQLIKSNQFDGLFFDGLGSQLWSDAYRSWPDSMKDSWMNGMVEFARRFDQLRRQLNPQFIGVGNNTWARGNFVGEQYMDGMVSEWHRPTNLAMVNMLGHAFSNLGHRRVFAMARPDATDADIEFWKNVQGVTHISVGPDYRRPYANPLIGYNDLRTDRIKALEAQIRQLNLELQMARDARIAAENALVDVTNDYVKAMTIIDKALQALLSG